MKIIMEKHIPLYIGYPLTTVGLYPQGYQYPQQDFKRTLPFMAMFDLPDMS